MAPLITLSDASLLQDLIDAFLESECVAQAEGKRSCRVIHVRADDPEEARVELTFFLRAWQLHHPTAGVRLQS